MFRFMAVLFVFLAVSATVSANDFYNPPLTGDMVRLKTLPEPKFIPEVILSKAGEGLVYLSEHKGKVILLNLWATWCPPCLNELPSLNALQTAMEGENFEVVTVSIDTMEAEKVRDFLVEKKWDKLQPYLDVNSDLQTLQILDKAPGVPISIILDRKMRAIAVFEGDADWNGRSARAVIDYYIENLPGPFEGLM